MPGGQGFNAGQGSVNAARAVLLRSNKNVTSVSVQLNGQSVGVPQGTFSTARARLLSGINLASAQYSFGGIEQPQWDVGAISVITGRSGQPTGQFDVAATLPAGYTAGGIFELGAGSGPLPVGMTLSTAGIVDVGSASIGSGSGIVFGYTEIGALPTLTLHGTGVDVPYLATVYPTEGAVPSGMTITSPDDPNLRASIVSAWPDGSAQVAVLAGQTTVSGTKPVRCRASTTSQTPLTDGRIQELVSTVSVNFTGTPQTLTLSGATKDLTWWANEGVICNRYRLSCGLGVMEAIVDIHAFASNRAFVEVVIENGKFDPSAVSTPGGQSYINATVSVNGVEIQGGSGVSSSDGPNGTHEAFRAWYCSGWVGGDPSIEVTHDTDYLQSHPWFWKNVTALTADMNARWGSVTYAPWSDVGLPSSNMGGAAGQEWIGVVQKWDADYIATGSKYARRAVLANALAPLAYNLSIRDSGATSGTNLVPSASQMAGKVQGTNWPRTTTEPAWEDAHQPAGPLVAFLCRPSPCFIEIAQKILAWNHTYREATGAPIYMQVRARAWLNRNMGIAAYLTPDSLSTWKAGARSAVAANIANLDLYRVNAGNPLGIVWNGQPNVNAYESDATLRVKGQEYIWQHWWLATVLHHIDKAKVLTGASASALTTVADWAAACACRFVNEPANGEWRALASYQQDVSTTEAPMMTQPADWAAVWTINMTGTPPAVTGQIIFVDRPVYDWSGVSTSASPTLDDNYYSHYWSALCCAVERDVSGAAAAYSKVTTGISNWSAWMSSAASTDGRNNRKPRNA